MSAPTVDPILAGVATGLQPKNGVVTLSGAVAPEVEDLLDAIGLTELAITEGGNGVAPQPGAVAVTGTATLFDTWTVDIVATFTNAQGALRAELHAGFPDDARMHVLGLPWAVVERLALDLSVTGPSDPLAPVSGELRGEIVLDGVKDPIGISLGPSFGLVVVGPARERHPAADPVAVLKTLLNDGSAVMPTSFALKDFDITSLAVSFDPSAETFHSLDVALGTTPGTTWSVAPHLDLTGIFLSCGIRFDGEQRPQRHCGGGRDDRVRQRPEAAGAGGASPTSGAWGSSAPTTSRAPPS